MRTINIKKGFTLIELLIVIAIIGILVAVGSVSYITALKQSRDTKRKTDLQQIRGALETYRADIGSYPTSSGWETALTASYIQAIPIGPQNDPYSYTLLTNFTYDLCTTLETTALTYCVHEP